MKNKGLEPEQYLKRATKQSFFSTERITTLVAILWGFFLVALILATALFMVDFPTDNAALRGGFWASAQPTPISPNITVAQTLRIKGPQPSKPSQYI